MRPLVFTGERHRVGGAFNIVSGPALTHCSAAAPSNTGGHSGRGGHKLL